MMMILTKYRTLLDEGRMPGLVKEREIEYSLSESGSGRIQDASMIVKMLSDVFDHDRETEEVAYLVCLNVKLNIIGIMEISRGYLNGTVFRPREIMMKAMLCNAHSIILAHNHPSGDPTPSKDDISSTTACIEAGKLLGIRVRDSIIVAGSETFVSMKEDEIVEF